MLKRVVDIVRCSGEWQPIANLFEFFEQTCCCSYWFLSICLWLMYNLCLCTEHAANVRDISLTHALPLAFLHTPSIYVCVWQILMPFIEYFILCLANNIAFASTVNRIRLYLPIWLEFAFAFWKWIVRTHHYKVHWLARCVQKFDSSWHKFSSSVSEWIDWLWFSGQIDCNFR